MKKLFLLLIVLYIGYFAFFSIENEIGYNTIETSLTAGEFTIPVLTYHSISDHSSSEYAVTREKFEQQMAYLHSHGYRALTLAQFELYMKQQKPVDEKCVLLTFDDGYANNYDVAFPILKKYGYTATLFVITDWVNSKPYMKWTQIKELHQAGWDIMPHSRTHPHLPLETAAKQKDEILGSKKAIEHILHSKVDAFAYPYGHRSQMTVDLIHNNGYSYAFTFDDGLTSSGQNPYLLKRLIVSGKEPLQTFIKRLNQKNLMQAY
ncbi:hypothetical protein Back11_20940 [Paenibacillus baekrokdamisoli]|uniref:Uncharacterized protein n=1 Tax=Paenibacillus baekrokdamisoli TaxID=1712516 RepID=A0A3G9JCR5_9BACL|nr:polysaccharide deacetylase family protein [Paenibacillus baekrokdamisoli]MBB3069898.1 peptidoglycan/xylan/chitin deacetylase (PgdA/CDA1 family) [Paenibacillus baekrokdamisoli]BBH20749.1 hypothetical protein Back11_20940 [Paenibacillus baekrokdamisoli]